MSPIDQVKPATPGNWTRRPEARIKRSGPDAPRDHRPKQKKRGPGSDRGDREHIVDELA